MMRVTQAHVDAREESILEAALVLFARKGIEKTTVQEIANEAGLSAGAIYRYYPGKDDLLRAVFEHCVHGGREAFLKPELAGLSPMERLFAIGRGVVGQSMESPALAIDPELTLAATRDPEGVGRHRRAMRLGIIEQIASVLEEGQAAGQVPHGVDVQGLAVGLLALTIGINVLQAELRDEVDGPAAFEAVANFVGPSMVRAVADERGAHS